MSTRYSAPTPNAAAGAAEFVPDLVVPMVTATAAREEVFMPRVRRIDKTGPGEIFTIPTAGALDFAQLGGATYIDGSEPVETAFNTNGRPVTPQFWFVDIVVPMDTISGAAAGLSVQDEIMKEVGIGLAKHRDSLGAAQHPEAPASSPAHNTGTDAVALAFSNLLENTKLLYTQNAPRPFAWIIHPTQWGELMTDNTLIDASVKGEGVLTQPMGANGKVTSVFDTTIYVSDQVKESSGLHSMMFSDKQALMYCYKNLTHPVTGRTQELMIDIDWNAARRSYEFCCTYQGAFEGLKGTSAGTDNNWIVDCIS